MMAAAIQAREEGAVANRTITLSDGMYDYLLDVSLREPDVLRRLREETAKIPAAAMQIAPEQGQFMALLVEVMGARNAIEVGTFSEPTARSRFPTDCMITCWMSR